MIDLIKKISIFILLISTVLLPFNSQAKASIDPESWPLEVYLYTDKSSYVTSEVVTWKVSISGGSTTGPNFDVKFTDSRGHAVWAYDLKSYTTSFSMDYPTSGKVTAYVTVHGVNGPVTDSHTITIKTNQ
ncbi:hypothetical protein [Mesobacillus sp. S13]|uniref:hypothetical protein n=1 Tax=Mesobacillus sp. S13 TaxID=2880221 RepID=UPI001CF1A419|nr:hypothetical protein [Mesobacillus sp. S13]